jgi:hypothetical protein
MAHDVSKKLEQIEEEKEDQGQRARELSTSGPTRNKLARTIVNFYFWTLILIIVGIPVYNFLMTSQIDQPQNVISVKDALLTYSAIVGPTLGLVIAYYFKTRAE